MLYFFPFLLTLCGESGGWGETFVFTTRRVSLYIKQLITNSFARTNRWAAFCYLSVFLFLLTFSFYSFSSPSPLLLFVFFSRTLRHCSRHCPHPPPSSSSSVLVLLSPRLPSSSSSPFSHNLSSSILGSTEYRAPASLARKGNCEGEAH